MKWDLSQFDGKEVIMTGQNRDMTATRTFLEKHAQAASYNHIHVDIDSNIPIYEQLGSPDLKKTLIIKAPGVPGRQMNVPYITSTQLFFKLASHVHAVVIGITGTKGKTTTASLTHAMLESGDKKTILCGNIGNSFLTQLEDASPSTIFVAELSSQMLEDMSASPHIGIITNLYDDHIDYHGSLEAYYNSKKHLVASMSANDLFIYNASSPMLQRWAENIPARKLAITGSENIDMSKSKLIGDHNRLNALMAQAAAMELGVSQSLCQRAIDNFEPVEHRLQPVATIESITYVDDAISSQPEAAIAGLKAVSESLGPVGCMLLGGKDRDYDFKELMHAIADAKVASLVLFPETIQKMKNLLPADYHPDILETSDMKQAVKWASKHSPKNSVVLLSCGAPSYSIWKDFEEKGDQFLAAVQSLVR